MTSRLLTNLENRIAREENDVMRAQLRAERAAHLARRGEMEDAKLELLSIRQGNSVHGNPRTSIWTHIAEGVVELTEGRELAAIDRFMRARAVAIAVDTPREISVVSAWLAYIAYTQNDLHLTVTRINEVTSIGIDADRSALGRSRLLVGQAFHFAGEYEVARPWYAAARDLAVESGDDGLTSALLFNIASLHVYNYRQYILRGRSTTVPLDFLALTTESVRNYDKMIGIDSLKSYAGTMVASLHLFHGRYREALEMFGEFVAISEGEGLGRMKSLYTAEMAYCAVLLGDESLAAKLASEAELAITEGVHVEDRAATRSRLAQIFATLGDTNSSSQQVAIAEVEWVKHEGFQREVLKGLTRLDTSVAGSR